MSVNGVAVTPTNVTATSLSFVVPAGGSATQSITVTTPGGTSAASTAFTVLLRVASTSPAADARTAPTATSASAATFTESVSAASAANVKVFSAQLGSKKAGTVTVAGATASFAATAATPRTNFRPGEVVSLSVADHFSEFYFTGSSTPLPVELTTFTATAVGNAAVRLAWATASEQNSQAFEVERSLDGASFGRIGTVAAAGSSSVVRSYELQDARLPASAALLYYRLKQVDLDGTFSYSPVRAVALQAAGGLALFPNPATIGDTLTGAVPGAAVTVFDAVGRAVLALKADAAGAARLVLPAGLPVWVSVVRTDTKALRLTVE